MSPIKIYHNAYALLVTLLLWGYFLFGSTVLFFLFQVPSYLFSKNSARAFQKFNHVNLKIFFALTRFLIPLTKFKIPNEIRQIKSSVIVCNHLSYLDPICSFRFLSGIVQLLKALFSTFLFLAGYLEILIICLQQPMKGGEKVW